MHDDVVDLLGLFFEVFEHLLECGSFGAGAGDAAFDELLDDLSTEAASLLLIGIPLRRDGEAFFTSSALGLFPG
ncbi:hypothetical protein RH857_07805 [Nesterenkonia flava]|uniref:Uncharacterized protein n=1 Tax=Nesterenkonia flava TaxID=469799 RepID=A0ABU1FTP9_9MICC|nr:hypothetical protein [Nesterenkonia flava]MDR5712032.1 hypothetical protein [Nesterenkonia flava]